MLAFGIVALFCAVTCFFVPDKRIAAIVSVCGAGVAVFCVTYALLLGAPLYEALAFVLALAAVSALSFLPLGKAQQGENQQGENQQGENQRGEPADGDKDISEPSSRSDEENAGDNADTPAVEPASQSNVTPAESVATEDTKTAAESGGQAESVDYGERASQDGGGEEER